MLIMNALHWHDTATMTVFMDTYLVGGAVRDELLGLTPKERDWVVVGSTPEAMLAQGFTAVGKDFPVFLHPQTREEYALARTERKTGHGYTGFACHADPGVTLEEDLQRRDLTINAMARDTQGQLIDPYGGQRDLEQRLLRHVSAAFVEDPLRVLRVARFAARLAPMGFSVADETMALMRNITASGELDHLVAERTWQELSRMLGEPAPQAGIRVLRDCGALAVILPEVDCLFGIPQPEAHHPEIDTGEHILMALEQSASISPVMEVRFAVLMHDLGKGITPEDEWPRHIAHEHRGVALVDAACQRLRAPREATELARLACKLHLNVHRCMEMRPDTLLKLLESMDVFRRPERLPLLIAACEADARGRGGRANQPYPQAAFLQAAADCVRSISGDAVTAEGLSGPAFGRALRDKRLQALQQWKASS